MSFFVRHKSAAAAIEAYKLDDSSTAEADRVSDKFFLNPPRDRDYPEG